jgi:site-specific recombinase XerD
MRLTDTLDAYFLAKDLTPSSIRWYESKLRQFVAWCSEQSIPNVEGLSAPILRQYIAYLRATSSARSGQPISSHTLHGSVRVVKAFLNWCIGDDLIPEKVTRRVEMPRREIKVIQTFSADHISKLFAAAGMPQPQYPWFADRDRAILAVLLDTGIRANELCDLTLDRVRITTDDSYITVNGKGRKQREVGLGLKSRQLLHRYIHRYRPKCDHDRIFVGRHHKPLQPEGIDRILYRLRDLSDIDGVRVSAHTFRHTFACRYLEDGGDVYKLSRLLGHTSVVVTEGYLRAFQARDARRSSHSVLDGLHVRR